MKIAIILLLGLTVISTYAQQDNIKISELRETREVLLQKEVDSKRSEAIKLISKVGKIQNERFSTEQEKEEVQFSYQGFLTRFQIIDEDREILERKEILPDAKLLLDYSNRLDLLIQDMQNYLK